MKSIARLAGFVACVLLSATVTAGASAAGKPFFRPLAPEAAKSAALGRPHGVVSDSVPVQFNAREMLALKPGEEVELVLPNGTSRPVVFELALDHGGGIRSWVGFIRDRGEDNRVILTTGPAGSFGVIDTPDGSYRIVPGTGHDWLVDMQQEQLHLPIPRPDNDAVFPPAALKSAPEGGGLPTFSEAIPGVNRVGLGKATPLPLADIDLLVVVTRGFANQLGATLMTRLNFLVTRANTAYADSEVGINLRLVGVTVVDYSDATSNSEALYAITPFRPEFSAATFGQIETIRTQVRADVVALMRNGASLGGSGVAWVGPAIANSQVMYSVTTGCMAGCESVFIHEVGHNMGNMHDRATAAWQDGGTTAYGQGAFAYSYGYAYCKSLALSCNPNLPPASGGCAANTQPECSTADNSNFSDIMAYFHASTQRLYKFSNPAVTCATANGDGVPRPCGVSTAAVGIGVADGSSSTAQSMNNTRAGISAIKTGLPALPGLLHFSDVSYTALETAGSLVFTVRRANGSAGAISVSYVTGNGTATAGNDFTAASGTLSWADGDTADKTITITVAADAVAEGNESFGVTLSAPTGNASLGYPFAATGIISEPFPVGGTMPTGFVTSTGANAGWSVATDSFNEGPHSLKSGAITHSQRADVETTVTTQAGNITFARRVSSEANFDFLRFYIDGTLMASWSGDVAWGTVSFPVAAGLHTFRWSYQKDDSVSLLLNTAWIDSVSLPPLQTGQLFTLTVTKVGAGAVTSNPVAISCGMMCSAGFAQGTTVTLTAIPDAGSTFIGWSGACAGTGSCSVVLNAASAVTATFTAPPNPPRLANISTRGPVFTGNDVMIGGFVIGGTLPKKVLITARGPSLTAFGVTGAIANPTMQLFSGQTVIAANDDWQANANAAEITATGIAPTNALESALLVTLSPGAYTAIVSGISGGTGVGIVEVFERDSPTIPLINISTRGQVQTGDNVMIGGFIIQGDAPQTVLITARGPSLIPFGIPNALANPSLQLFSGQTLIASNDDFGTAPNLAQIQATGVAPTNALESAILVTLNPGAYTAIVRGAGGGTGVGIVEVFAQ